MAGFLARLLVRGDAGVGPSGLIGSTLLGVAGALIGGYISTRLGYGDVAGFDIRSVGIATGGAVLLIVVARLLGGR
ncbi:MAG: transglycosylase [Chloroflexota bacterium]